MDRKRAASSHSELRFVFVSTTYRLPFAKFGHREKFGNTAEKHRDFSVVTQVAEHPDVTAQARRLGNVLKDAGIAVTVFGAQQDQRGPGVTDDATKVLMEFVAKGLKQ